MKCLICTSQFTNDDEGNKIGGEETTINAEKEEDCQLVDSFSQQQQQLKRDLWAYFCSHFHVSNHKDHILIDLSNHLQLPFCLKCTKDVSQLFNLNSNLIKIQNDMQHLTANISSSILMTSTESSSLNSKNSQYKNNGDKENNSENRMDQEIDKIRVEITQHLYPKVVLCDVMTTNSSKVQNTQPSNQNNKSTKTIQDPPANNNNNKKKRTYSKLDNQSNPTKTRRENVINEHLLPVGVDTPTPFVVYICPEPECERRKFCNVDIWKNHQKYHQLPKTVKKHEQHSHVYLYKDEWAFKELVDRKNEYQCLTCDRIFKYHSRILDHVRDVHCDPPNCECGQKLPFRHKLASHLKDKVCWSGKQMERWFPVQDEEGNISFLYDNIWPISILETRLNIQWTDPDASFRCETCGFENTRRGLMTEHIQKFHLNPDSSSTCNSFMDSWRSAMGETETDVNVNVQVKVDPYPQAENFLTVEIKTEAEANDNEANILKLQSEVMEETFKIENEDDDIYNCEFEYETVLQDDNPEILPFLHEEVTEIMSQCEYELSSSSSASASLTNLMNDGENNSDSDDPIKNKKRKTKTEDVNWSPIADYYKCCFQGCTKSYATLQDLELHKKLHSGERIKCGFAGCSATFIQESVMITHMWAIHKMKLDNDRNLQRNRKK